MPLQPDHISKFLDQEIDTKYKSELLDLLNKRINHLCFEDCQVDRIQCTLTPLCFRRFLITLRIKNGLYFEDLPKFCYSVHKNVISRDFRNKTVVYKPLDSYLYLVDFLDVFFHGDYRKLNKFLSKRDWKPVFKIFDDRIKNREEDFQYLLTRDKNYMVFKYGDRIHVVYINENYVLCNASREIITDIEILKGLFDLFSKIYFPEVKITKVRSDFVEIRTLLPKDVLTGIKNPATDIEKDETTSQNHDKREEYLWNVFPEDIETLTQFCQEIEIKENRRQDITIRMRLNTISNMLSENNNKLSLNYRDLRLIFNILFRWYNDFYIIWV